MVSKTVPYPWTCPDDAYASSLGFTLSSAALSHCKLDWGKSPTVFDVIFLFVPKFASLLRSRRRLVLRTMFCEWTSEILSSHFSIFSDIVYKFIG
jgi:hypothetical protein